MKLPKKLIEVALPLDEINAEASREKSLRHGHPSTLHLWWARRPLAAARAVLFAQLVNDPGGQRGWSKGLTKEQAAAKREYLFNIIRELVKWENSNNEELLTKAREAILDSWRETCALNKGDPAFDEKQLPPFHDPFAGGGAIPLEAQRLGMESFGSDLNPVPVMLNKAMIEIPSRFRDYKPVGPLSKEDELRIGSELSFPKVWHAAEGMAEDIRRYGKWMRERAYERIGSLYPDVVITKEMVKGRRDLEGYIGRKLRVISWIWARTVKSPNPEYNDVDIPLVRSFVISNTRKGVVWVEPVVDSENRSYSFAVRMGGKPELENTVSKKGAICVMSRTSVSLDYVRSEAKAGRMGKRLMAIVLEGDDGRLYVSPSAEIESAVDVSLKPQNVPKAKIDHWAGCTNCVVYGLDDFSKLFSDRQLMALTTFSDLVKDVRDDIVRDAREYGLKDGEHLAVGGTGAIAYAEAVSIYLAFVVDKCSDYWSTMCTWHNTGEKIGHTFGRQAIPMSWDYAEANPFSESSGNWLAMVNWVVEVVENLPCLIPGHALQHDAAQPFPYAQLPVVSTDPPYYDNVPYSNISDYFYVWMRRSLREIYPDLFATIAVPKAEELVANQFRHGGKENALNFFMNGMSSVFSTLAKEAHPAFPITIYYAFKATEKGGKDDNANKGWESFLQSVLDSGFVVTGTWPMNTEMGARRMAVGNNALASSIVLVCRKRPEDAEQISRGRFNRELREAMFDALEEMTNAEGTQSSIAAVDLAQAAIGPGMGVYSKYAAVLKSDGSKLSVHEAMIEINREIERYLHPDGQSYDPSTNFFVTWFEQHGYGEGAYGEADVLARAKGTTVDYVVASEVAESKGGKMRILHYSEYPGDKDYDPREDKNLPLWEACHRVIRELEKRNRRAAAELLAKMPSMAADIRQLAYYLFTYCEKHGDAANARAYNALITSWSDIMTLMGEIGDTPAVETQGELGI